MGSRLCQSCTKSIWCDTWGEWKCKELKTRIYNEVNTCKYYKKRGKDFKESDCQCEECLEHVDVEE